MVQYIQLARYRCCLKLTKNQSWPSSRKIPETQVTVAGGSTCRVNIRMENPTKHDITLKGRTAPGHLQHVKSVTPLEVKLKEANSSSGHVAESPNADKQEQCTDRGGDNNYEEQPCSYITAVDFEELTEEKRTIVRLMLVQEGASLSRIGHGYDDYPDYDLPFVLHRDMSNEGLGTVLYQRQSGKMHVIGCGSRTLTPTGRNYHHSRKLEFLALKWAICEQIRDYLYYAVPFTVYMDVCLIDSET